MWAEQGTVDADEAVLEVERQQGRARQKERAPIPITIQIERGMGGGKVFGSAFAFAHGVLFDVGLANGGMDGIIFGSGLCLCQCLMFFSWGGGRRGDRCAPPVVSLIAVVLCAVCCGVFPARVALCIGSTQQRQRTH